MSSKRFELLAPTHICSYHINADTGFTDPEYFPKIAHVDGSWICSVFHCLTAFKQFIYNAQLNRLADVFDVTRTIPLTYFGKFIHPQCPVDVQWTRILQEKVCP